jgi:NAD(P)-dependent dehydrogenase (short-subunit alcohol dehydrogenase family)
MSEQFDGRWIVVSGASSGIGRAIAVELVRRGARAALIGRREAELAETARLCGDSAATAVTPLDVTKTESVGEAIASLVARVGRLYGFCHCAGIVQTLPLAATSADRLQSLLNVNLVGGIELARAVTRRDAIDPAGGCILWLASVYAHVGAPGQIGYCATKGAISAAVRAMALELAPRKIRVNSLSPGLVATPMTEASRSRMTADQWKRLVDMHPLGTGTPEDVARAAAFMLDPQNRWLTGTDLVLDGGYTAH